MSTKWAISWIVCLLVLAHPGAVVAGMPSPLPTDVDKFLMLNDTALKRLQAISFFLVAFFLSAAVLRFVWNYLQRDFPSLPRLTFSRALAAIFLWGLLFVIVLTMISGARELMTPGAWTKQGFTYKLADEPTPPEVGSEAQRRQHLEKLRTALWQFAATHQGHFPAEAEITAISSEFWQAPGLDGMRLLYVAGRSAGHLPEILVYEPEIEVDRRLVLQSNGDIVMMRSTEIRDALTEGKRP